MTYPQTQIKAAMIGNPNSGKSTIFNFITGARQHVGNYPGVTVEKYEGSFKHKGREINLVDLPGVYSLSAGSDEERVALEYLINESPDIVINIVDASNLERNLYLTILLKEMGVPLLVVLNMMDMAKRNGIIINRAVISELLDVPVVEMVGVTGAGGETLLDHVVEISDNPGAFRYERIVRDKKRSEDAVALAVERYGEIAKICSRCVTIEKQNRVKMSNKIDSVLTNRWLGIPIFLLLMYLVFQLTFTLGAYPMDWIDSGFAYLGETISHWWPNGQESLFKSLLVDGIIGGVGGVIIFLPNILLLFLAISFLEDSGYMARAAFMTDRFMRRVGLHGKSFIPMLIGFGCSVPAIMATRTLPSRKDRLITMFVVPLMSCGARLPIYALLIPAFFPLQWQAPVLWLIYCLGIVLAIITAKILSLFILPGEEAPFIIELPPYHLPTFRTVGIHTLERGWLYLKKAGTVILGISILLWGLTTFPQLGSTEKAAFENQRAAVEQDVKLLDEERQERIAAIDNAESEQALAGSYAGRFGRSIEPVLRPMGFDWKIGTALVGAIAAKEVFVAQMGIIYKVGEADEESESLRSIMSRNYSPLVGLGIMIFCLISAPCMASFAVMGRESGSWGWAVAQWIFLTSLAWIMTTILYQVGCMFHWGI